jgi:hypothetical protein
MGAKHQKTLKIKKKNPKLVSFPWPPIPPPSSPLTVPSQPFHHRHLSSKTQQLTSLLVPHLHSSLAKPEKPIKVIASSLFSQTFSFLQQSFPFPLV